EVGDHADADDAEAEGGKRRSSHARERWFWELRISDRGLRIGNSQSEIRDPQSRPPSAARARSALLARRVIRPELFQHRILQLPRIHLAIVAINNLPTRRDHHGVRPRNGP